MTYHDFVKTKLRIDERHNYFMYGVTMSLISHYSRSFWYITGMIVAVIVIGIYFKRFLGAGDVQAITWAVYGFAIINYFAAVVYLALLCAISLINFFLKKYAFKFNNVAPFFHVLTISFILTALIVSFWLPF